MNVYVRFFAGCLLAVAASVSSADEGVLVTTFIPVNGKMREFVAVELIRLSSEDKQYQSLKKAVLSGGWRAERKGDSYEIPGKCTVEVLAGGQYAVDCWLIHSKGQDVLKQEVKTCEEAVEIIKVFSRLRLFRQPSKKERMIKITIA